MKHNSIKVEPDSTLIKSIVYSYGTEEDRVGRMNEKILVEFKDGKIFEYYPVLHMEVFENMEFGMLFGNWIASESVGKFWHKNIKDKLPLKVIRK